jgi:hypothetical protein
MTLKNGYAVIETITPQRTVQSWHRTRQAADREINRRINRVKRGLGNNNSGIFAVVAEVVDGEVVAPGHVTSGLRY